MVTSRGVYHDISESIYSFTYLDFVFYFSSELYKNKFKKEVESYVKNETKKLEVFYKLKNEFSIFFAISLYKKIEKRGFRIIDNKRNELKESEVIFLASIK